LSEHNTFRALHSAPALVWNQTLADKAASWANKCVFQHSQGALGRYGENLAASAGSGVTVQTALSGIKAWEAEAPDYTPDNPNYSHFTQMVWKASKQLGCYQASCPAGSIFDARYGVNSVRPRRRFLARIPLDIPDGHFPRSCSSSSASTTLLYVPLFFGEAALDRCLTIPFFPQGNVVRRARLPLLPSELRLTLLLFSPPRRRPRSTRRATYVIVPQSLVLECASGS
ncbi:uncharacterized protein RHOBADRAFT_16288, partial [Rhodotorula graminis WP1]